jgi:formate-dependent nitrite reductase membrane component NrfD
MAGSSLLAAGADLTGNRALRRAGRLAAALNLGVSAGLLVHDLGRPERFATMLRMVKPTSPMNVGSWILAAYGPPAGLAAASEVTGLLPGVGRAAGLGAAVVAPAVASYTAVLLADTAVPSWHDAHPQLPFVFVGSAGAAAGGLATTLVQVVAAAPARRLAVLGAVLELAAGARMERRTGRSAEPYAEGRAGTLNRWARALTGAGALGTALLARRSRGAAIASGAALVAGSACTRFAVLAAGVQSAADPASTVGPQRARLEARRTSSHASSSPGVTEVGDRT